MTAYTSQEAYRLAQNVGVSSMIGIALLAFAALLRARENAKPLAWVVVNEEIGFWASFKSEREAISIQQQHAAQDYHGNYVYPLFSHPPTDSAEAKDIPQSLGVVVSKLRRFFDCADDFESGGCGIGREWFDALTTIGLLERVQRSPAIWQMTKTGEALIEESREGEK